jgi:hypothetical protein
MPPIGKIYYSDKNQKSCKNRLFPKSSGQFRYNQLTSVGMWVVKNE